MENQKEFVESLFNKKDKKKLWVLPEITKKEIDLEEEKVVSWIHPSGHLGYVIYNDNGVFTAFILERLIHKGTGNRVAMCSWCLSVRPQTALTMFSRKLNKTVTQSISLCGDLNCKNSIRNINENTMRETLTFEEKEERYADNVKKYIEFIKSNSEKSI